MDPLNPIRNGFVHGRGSHSHFYAAWTSRHILSSIDLPWPFLIQMYGECIPILILISHSHFRVAWG